MSFDRLVRDIARERDLRATARQAQIQIEGIRADGRAHRKAIAGLTGELRIMAKSMHADLVQTRATQRQDAIDTLAKINEKATAMAASGQLSAYEGALIDGAIARAADRIRSL